MHELQKEQGMSAGFIGSKSSEFVPELKNQRTLTDKEVNSLKSFMVDINYHQQINKTMQKLFNNLGQLCHDYISLTYNHCIDQG